MPAVRAISANIRGRVHGVGFRYTTQSRAKDLGLVGWVRNEKDGSVSVWAQGPSDAIEQLTDFLEIGPRAARVTESRVEDVEPDSTITAFRVAF